MLSTILFSIVEPELARNQVYQCRIRPIVGSHYTRKTIKAVRFSGFMKKAQKSYVQFHLRHKDRLNVNSLVYSNLSQPTSLINKHYCYIASAETKRDWLIHGHVALDKCNVSLGQ